MPSSSVSPLVAAVSDPGGTVVSVLARLRVLAPVLGEPPTAFAYLLGALERSLAAPQSHGQPSRSSSSRPMSTSGAASSCSPSAAAR